MAGARIRVDVDDRGVQAALGRMASTLDGPRSRDVFDAIGQALAKSTVDRFAREAGPDGARWPQSRRAREEGDQTLTDTARLRQSITHAAGPDHVDVGTNVLYAAIHQFGGEIRPKAAAKLAIPDGQGGIAALVDSVTMPARPFLGIDGRDRDAIADIVLRALGEAAA